MYIPYSCNALALMGRLFQFLTKGKSALVLQGSTSRALWLQALYTQGATGEHPQGYWPGDKYLKSQTFSR
jgi:hypothetical protein